MTFNWEQFREQRARAHKRWIAHSSKDGKDNYDRYMSHDWEAQYMGGCASIKRCKVCGYIDYGIGEGRIPSCEEYMMKEALE